MTTMPAWLAKQRDLSMPRKAAIRAADRQTGPEIRAELLLEKAVLEPDWIVSSAASISGWREQPGSG
jgi:hypothetical protein